MLSPGPDGLLTVGNGVVALHFSHGYLTRLESLRDGFSLHLNDGADGGAGLWQVVLRSPEGRCLAVEPSGPPHAVTPIAGGDGVRLDWKQQVESSSLAVSLSISLDEGSAASRWRASVRYDGPLSVWEVVCPRLAGLAPLSGDGAGDRLAIPWQYGGLLPDPIGCIARGGSRAYGASMDYGFYDAEAAIGMKASRVAYSYPGMWALQFLAFYNPGTGGIYLGAHDAGARYKRFGLYGDEGVSRADLVMQHYPDERLQPGLDYSTPYDTVVAMFKGEWWQASAIYRQWALEQEWCRKGPLAARDDIPEWLLETDIWYWNWRPKERLGNHGRPEHLVPAILDLKQRLGAEMAFHWYEWDSRPFNGAMPEIIPLTRAELQVLRQGTGALHEGGVHAIPYINGRLWTTNHPDWESGGSALACRTPDGQVAWYDNHEGIAQICPYTERWQDIQTTICNYIVSEGGLDGAYVDQITSCYAVPCFAEGHGHPRGGGNSWYAGYRKLMERVQREGKALCPGTVFTSESTIDCYLDLFDANLAREASELSAAHGEQWLPIPLFHSVYHDYAITYGSAMRLVEPFPDAYYYGEALVLNGGQQLMVEDYMSWDVGTGDYAEYLEYLRRLVQARRLARPFLLSGRWLPPVDMEVDRVDVSWSDSFAPKRDVPAVLASTWQLGESLCLLFVNHTEREREISYTLSIANGALPTGSRTLYRMEQAGEVTVEPVEGGQMRRQEVVPARSALVYELR